MIRTLLCVGGPLDGQRIAAHCKYLEAMAEDFRVAQYEATAETYELKGHFIIKINGMDLEREFVPLSEDSGSPAD